MPLIEYDDASPGVRAVYDDIIETRQVDWVNNFWKALASDPVTLRRTWESVKEVMAPRRARSTDEGATSPCRSRTAASTASPRTRPPLVRRA